MITRSIYIGNPAYLKLRDEQMYVMDPGSQETKGQIPIEDLGVLMLDHYQITLTHQLLQKMMDYNVVVISCDTHHLPHGIMLPLYGHTEYSQKIKYQLEASEPLKKQLWKQTVESKINNQKIVLKSLDGYYAPMNRYGTEVKSGDSSNMEGVAAQHYWKHLISTDFIRNRFGEYPNVFFNFGYAVLRSMIARAIVEAGLLPVIGIFHKNKYNPFCLADDLMEPYRPYVDLLVMKWIRDNPDAEELSRDFKAASLRIATVDVWIEGKTSPLMVAIKTTTASLYKCFTGEKRQISYPEMK